MLHLFLFVFLLIVLGNGNRIDSKINIIFSFHFWFRDLLRELETDLLFVSFFWTSFHLLSSHSYFLLGEGFYLTDPCQLTFANTLLLSNAAINLGNSFISLEITLLYFIIFSLFSLIFSQSFISLQIKEFCMMALSINDSIYSCLFFFLTRLHFFHLSFGLFLLSLLFWSCSLPHLLCNKF